MKSAGGPLRAGIAGAGLMARWHADAIKRAGGRLAAVADPRLEAARRLASGHNDARPFSSVEQMLADSHLDVLHVCSPLLTHRSIAELAIDARVHLLVEKPVAPTSGETERLFDLASTRRVLLCPVHQFLFQDGVLKALKLLPTLGRLIHLQATFCSAGGAGQSGADLDAIAADILPHPLSLMQVFLPSGLTHVKWETRWPDYGELRASGECGGVSLTIHVSLNSRPTVCSLQIFGVEGTAHLNLFHGYVVMESGEVSRARKIVHPFNLGLRTLGAAVSNLSHRLVRWEPAYPGLQRLVSSFYLAAQGEAPPPISIADALAVAAARDRLMQRDALGEPLAL